MKTIKELFNEAFCLLIEKENDGTIDYYFLINNVIQFRCSYFLKYSLKDTYKLQNVINILNQILTIDPKHKNIYEFLAIAYRYIDEEKAIEIAKKGLEMEPENAYLSFRIGVIYFANAKYQTSLNYLKQAHNLDNSNPVFINKIGHTYLKLMDYENSKRYFEYLLKYNPEDFDSFYNIGNIYYEQQKYVMAHRFYLTANKIKEGEKFLLYKIVICYSKMILPKLGLGFANELIERFPNYWYSYYAKSLIMEKINSKKELLDFYEHALNQNIDFNNLVTIYVYNCSKVEAYEQGLKMMDKLLIKNPLNCTIIYNRAYLYYKLNQFQEALNDLNIVVKKQPSNKIATELKNKIITSLK